MRLAKIAGGSTIIEDGRWPQFTSWNNYGDITVYIPADTGWKRYIFNAPAPLHAKWKAKLAVPLRRAKQIKDRAKLDALKAKMAWDVFNEIKQYDQIDPPVS